MPLEPVIKLVVTGDDFGYCPRRDQGIVECFRAGALSNVSLLVNGSAAAGAAELAQRYNIPIGLHANLSEGRPVCPELRQNSSLISARGVFLGKLGIRTALEQGLLSMSEVRQELCAQVNLFHELTGQNPQHMDGHQHVHVLPSGLIFTSVSALWDGTCPHGISSEQLTTASCPSPPVCPPGSRATAPRLPPA
ncbi:carbohydrate deacetylase isoform X3 [Ascaphus truei]|uniref:carbohydrate deacetylase isoform X3 n=1 Tax=Ascaphus truei TaxID=8439 RepID=UPI003F59D534